MSGNNWQTFTEDQWESFGENDWATFGGSAEAGVVFDPNELRAGLLTDGQLAPSLVLPGFAGGVATVADLKPSLKTADGKLKPSLLDSEGRLKPSLRKNG